MTRSKLMVGNAEVSPETGFKEAGLGNDKSASR
jgi:hypothetical protein